MREIEKLENQAKDLREQSFLLDEKREALEREVLRPGLERDFVGRFFRDKEDLGGGEYVTWHQYVVGLTNKFNVPNPTFIVYYFGESPYGGMKFEIDDRLYKSHLGKEITKDAFMKAYDLALKEIRLPFEVED